MIPNIWSSSIRGDGPLRVLLANQLLIVTARLLREAKGGNILRAFDRDMFGIIDFVENILDGDDSIWNSDDVAMTIEKVSPVCSISDHPDFDTLLDLGLPSAMWGCIESFRLTVAMIRTDDDDLWGGI